MSVQNLKLKVLTKFPATVTVGSGLTLTNTNGVYAFTLAGALGAIGALPTAGAKTVLAGGGGAPSWSASPTIAGLTVSANAGASLPAAPTGTALQVAGADGANVFSTYDAFGGASLSTGTQFRKARGTAAAPTALQADDPIGGTYAFGYGATGYSASQRGFAGWFAKENWSDTAQGTYAVIYTTPTGATASAEALRLDSDKSAIFSGPALKPTISAGATLGTATLPFSNAFFANGTKLDWANGNVALTHSTGKLTLGGTLAIIGGAIDLSGSSAGQVIFPATQNASAGANTLDDYEEGTWGPPALVYATVGDSTWGAPSTQVGSYTKVGRQVILGFIYAGSTTHTTSAGTMSLSGATPIPFTAASIGSTGTLNYVGALSWQGVTKASYTNVVARIVAGGTSIDFPASGSGQAISLVGSADVPTGGTVALTAVIPYFTA